MNPRTPSSDQCLAQSTSSANHQDPYKKGALLVAAMVIITPIIAIGAVVAGSPTSSQKDAQYSPAAAHAQNSLKLVSAQTLYNNTCKICHGDDGQGIPRLGKPLRNSAYVQDNTDETLFSIIADGRMPEDPLNTTGTLMPPRGAQNMSDDAIHKVIGYLREMQDTTQPTVSVDAWIVEQSAASEIVIDDSILNHPGREIFVASCSACHGPNGEGIEGLGKPFTTSEFVRSSTDKELMTMIKMGRPVWDAANTTGLDMPSKGGNPAITDDQLDDIIAYIRSVSQLTN